MMYNLVDIFYVVYVSGIFLSDLYYVLMVEINK